MKSKFKGLFEKIVKEATGEEAKTIKKGIEDIRSIYGEVAASELENLLSIVDEYSDKLKTLRSTLKTPKFPKSPKEIKFKSKTRTERYAAKYPQLLNKYNEDMKIYLDSIKTLNEEKLKRITSITVNASNYKIPKKDECQLEYVLGNSKVGDDTIIINMGPATACDAAKRGQCELYNMGFCYAQNNETTYKLAIVKRFREKLQWKTADASTIASQIAAIIMQKRKPKRALSSLGAKNIKYVRFNESGDLSDSNDKIKLGKIVKETNKILIANKTDPVVFYTYTHRSDLFKNNVNDISRDKDLVIQGSGFYKTDGKPTKTPFFVDNCFMGIDYPNLVDLVRSGNFAQLTNPEVNPELGGIDFGTNPPKHIVICKGACMNCTYCKLKNQRLLILVVYHGTGTKIKAKYGLLTKTLTKMAKKSADKLVNLYHLPDEFKRELYDVNHFNEYIIAERLVNYASHRGLKGNKIPIISFDSIVPFILDLRKLTKQDEEKAKELMSPEDIKKFTPRIWTAGSRFKDIKTLVNYVADAKRKDEAFLSGAKVEPTEVEEEKYKFNVVFTDIISEVKSSMNASPSLNSLSIDDLRNLAVANKLSQHKDYISPNSVQEMLEDEQVNINVTQELEDEK